MLAIKKDDFFELFWRAWTSSFAEKTILSYSKATSIAPLDRDVMLKRFTDKRLEALSSRESSTSALNGDDWRKLDRLVRSAVSD
jgi:hypothetical protein